MSGLRGVLAELSVGVWWLRAGTPWLAGRGFAAAVFDVLVGKVAAPVLAAVVVAFGMWVAGAVDGMCQGVSVFELAVPAVHRVVVVVEVGKAAVVCVFDLVVPLGLMPVV